MRSASYKLSAGVRQRGRQSCAELAGDLVGVFSGPSDASVNKRYLDEAMRVGAKRRKKRSR